MSMHLVGPYLTTTKYSRSREKITKSKQQELEQGWRDRNQRLKSMGLAKETFEQYLDWVYGRGKKTKKTSTNKPASPAPTPVLPTYKRSALETNSQNKLRQEVCAKTQDTGHKTSPWITGAVSSPAPKVYTGDKILGIAAMHKSNLVPVFSDQEAQEIATMRRN